MYSVCSPLGYILSELPFFRKVVGTQVKGEKQYEILKVCSALAAAATKER